MNWTWRRHLLVVLGLTAVAGGVRFFRLGEPGLWGDELATVHGALNNQEFLSKRLGYLPTRLGLMATGLGPDRVSVSAVTEWRAKGLDEFAARWPSCMIGVLTVPLVYLATCAVVSPGAAALAGLFLALSHWHLLWSQSARFYAPQFLFYTLSLMVYFRATRTGAAGHWAGAMILAGLACLSQPTAGVIFIVFVVHTLARRMTGDIRAFAVKPLVIAGVLAGAVIAVVARDVIQKPDRWAQFFRDRGNLPPFRLIFSSAFYVELSMMAAGFTTAVWMWLRKRSELGLFLLLAGVIPSVVFSIVGLRAFVEVRYALGCLYPWLLLAAIGCTELAAVVRLPHGRLLGVVPAVALVGSQATMLYGYFTEGGYRGRIRDAYAYVVENYQPGDRLAAEMLEGPYYVGRPLDYDIWREWRELEHAAGRVWVVCGAINQGSPRKWLRENGDLRAAFSTHVAGPGETVYVYLIDSGESH
ncbi:MAG: phospholipid carrier-dependent glycosyltransferase [Phycisphaerales bacterium]|nr:phospholipid carrier-dependent glycosyltransferase [Phycisphaerales bacterium]